MTIIITDTHLKEENIKINIDFYNQVLSHCNSGDTVLHLGDVFDNRKGQTDLCLKTFYNILNKFKTRNVEIVVIPGNHDKTNYLSELSYLNVYESFENFKLIDDFYLDDDGYAFLPFFNSKVYLEKLQKLTKRGEIFVLFTHIGIDGGINNNVKVESDVFQDYFRSIVKVVSGHYHNYNKFGKFEYIGSSIQHNFGETEDKWVYYLDGFKIEKLFKPILPKYVQEKILLSDSGYKNLISDIVEQSNENKENKYKLKIVGNSNELKDFVRNKKILIPQNFNGKIDLVELNEYNSFIKENEAILKVDRFSKNNCMQEFEQFENYLELKNKLKKEKKILKDFLENI